MPDITKKCAIELRWREVSSIVSDEIEEILGLRIQCTARIEEIDFWDILFEDYRLPIPALCQLLQAVQAMPKEWEETLPCEGGTEIWDIGMMLSEKLLGRHLALTWEHSLITEDSLWLVGVSASGKSRPAENLNEGNVCTLGLELIPVITDIADCLHRLENVVQGRCKDGSKEGHSDGQP